MNERIWLRGKRWVLICLVVCLWLATLGLTMSTGQDTARVPDVWEREFEQRPDWNKAGAEGQLRFLPVADNEVLVYMGAETDHGILFFEGTIVRSPALWELRQKWGGGDLTAMDRRLSCAYGVPSTSGYRPLSDGGGLRWFTDWVKKEGRRGRVSAVHLARHTTYYNLAIVLERTDAKGNTLWERVYMYFDPWWGNQLELAAAAQDESYCFYYFKHGCLALVDEKCIFLYFRGTKTIYRLDARGLPHTDDKRLVVMSYEEYRSAVKKVLDTIDEYKWPPGDCVNPTWGNCLISGQLPDGSWAFLGDYDYTGEVLAKRMGFDVNSDQVRRVKQDRLTSELQQCSDAYHRIPIE